MTIGKQINKAYVLSLYDTGLAAVRSLGRAGIQVVGLDSDHRMAGFKSRFCTTKLCPNPSHQPDELLHFLIEEGMRQSQAGIIFPASDAFALFVSRYRDELSTFFRFNIAPSHVIEAMINKRLQYEMAERVGIPYPKTYYPKTIQDVHNLKDVLEYPIFIKPYVAHLWKENVIEGKGFKVHENGELQARFEEIIPMGIEAMVQEIIPGPNTNHFKVCTYIDSQGKSLGVFTLRKIRQHPEEFGTGTLVESVHYPELAEMGLRFFEGIGYRGIGSIEFKIDARDGNLKLIELNPRLWLQNAQATVCGMNFPLMQYLDLTKQNPLPVRDFLVGVKWIKSDADFVTSWDRYQRGELSLREWIFTLKGMRSFSIFAMDDLAPFFHAIEYGSKLLRIPRYLLRNRK